MPKFPKNTSGFQMKGSEFYGKSPLTRPKWLKALGAVATGGLSLIGSKKRAAKREQEGQALNPPPPGALGGAVPTDVAATLPTDVTAAAVNAPGVLPTDTPGAPIVKRKKRTMTSHIKKKN